MELPDGSLDRVLSLAPGLRGSSCLRGAAGAGAFTGQTAAFD